MDQARVGLDSTSAVGVEQIGHAFRGELIDLCARVERWAIQILASCEDKLGTPKGRKSTYLFGHKLEAVLTLAVANPEKFRNAGRVETLLISLKPLAELRSKLAHAEMCVSQGAIGTIFQFEVASECASPPYTSRFWMTEPEMRDTLSSLKRIVKELRDQKLR